MQPDVPESVLDVNDEQLAAVASFLPELPNISAEPADRFAQAVRALVEKRAQEGWPNESEEDVAVFVMVEHPRQAGERHGARAFADPMARDEPLLGRLFFTNRDASAGRTMQMPADANAILEWLEDEQLADRPVVTVYRQSKTMVSRRTGTNDLARRDRIRDQRPSATLQELMEALGCFHVNQLLTPSCDLDGLWESKQEQQYVPGPQPEKSIQSALRIALGSWFHGVVRAEPEDRTNIGRIDVRLLKIGSDGAFAYWAIMELKVIKSLTNAPRAADASQVTVSANVDAVVEGIRQAWAFRDNRQAEEGLLEIYDLRRDKGQNLMMHDKVVAAMAQYAPAPPTHVWPVFGSSSDARKAGFTGL